MLLVWGRRNSFNVQKVLWACDELGYDWRLQEAGYGHGVNNTQEYLKKNPNGLVPLIEDDGFLLWESNAILRYLSSKDGDLLYPGNIHIRADIDRWLDWQLGTLWPAMMPVFIGLIRTPYEERDVGKIASAWDRTAGLWKILDSHLQGRNYISEEKITIADIAIGVLVYRWFSLGANASETPHLYEWYRLLSGNSCFKEHVMLPLS